MTHKHDLAEMETACADGQCPICLANELENLRARIAALEAVAEAAKTLAACSVAPRVHGLCTYCGVDLHKEQHKDWCNYEIASNDFDEAYKAIK